MPYLVSHELTERRSAFMFAELTLGSLFLSTSRKCGLQDHNVKFASPTIVGICLSKTVTCRVDLGLSLFLMLDFLEIIQVLLNGYLDEV
jgi:hypothetical protein